MTVPIHTRGPIERRALEQLERCVATGSAVAGALMGDHHLGYSVPIGGVIAWREHVSPNGVGWDIACGCKAVLTDLRASDVNIGAVMDEIVRRISFGMGRVNDEPVEHAVLDEIAHAEIMGQRNMVDLAAKQLGTVGSGNHFVDLFQDEKGWLWVGVHFGSRGFGHKTAGGFLALAQGKKWGEKAAEGPMESPPVLLSTRTDIGQAYIEAMELAGRYAYAGRDVVVQKVLDILGARALYDVHAHHNYAFKEKYDGEDVWVIRKGATPAFPGQQGFVGATMGEPSVILEGIDSPAAPDLLYSTVHGAGRVMSRTEAAGKQGTVAECTQRDCNFRLPWKQYVSERETHEGHGKVSFTKCPDHPSGRMKKQRRRIREGKVDWPSVKTHLGALGIELRGGGADEAPEAYKRLDDVLGAHSDTVQILHTLRPLGVAMAGPDIEDRYRD